MGIQIVEIKAKSSNSDKIRTILNELNAHFKGKDHQIDTYFKVNHGRLKLREGNIENHLIHYERSNQKGPKLSQVLLYKSNPASNLKSLLTSANGVLTIVDKEREIFFIENVKFHIDTVKNLGSFVEIEAIEEKGEKTQEELLAQCQYYMQLFTIKERDLIANSYSDLMLKIN